MKNIYEPHILGKQAEEGACEYLKREGFKLIAQNYHCRLGEIDLIMRDGKILVFIEVRLRTSPLYGTGLESITQVKRQKIIRTAKYYLLVHQLIDKISCRFDVISVTHVDGKFDFLWVSDAFED